jgi:DNA primase
MMNPDLDVPQPRISLLDYLQQHGWKIVHDRGGAEVAGLCPLHRESRPSFYVNRCKQVFYCHGCGRGGGLARLIRWLDGAPQTTVCSPPPPAHLLERTYRFYQQQLVRSQEAQAYLTQRGIVDGAILERMRIGYAPGACLCGYLRRLGYDHQALRASGLADERGRDTFFRRLTFPLEAAGNLYGRWLADGMGRHRFLPGTKGGLYGWTRDFPFSSVILVEGLFDLASLWQTGFDRAVAALGAHLHNLHLSQLCQTGVRTAYICFDADLNGSGQRAACRLSVQLRHAGIEALRVALPEGHDPNSFFAAGAGVSDFQRCLERARP